MFRSSKIFGFLLSLGIYCCLGNAVALAQEDPNPPEPEFEIPKDIPEKCIDSKFAPKKTEGQTPFEAILAEATSLYNILDKFPTTAEGEKTNFGDRSYLWFRQNLNFDESSTTFKELGKTACLRSDLRVLDGKINEIQSYYKEKTRSGSNLQDFKSGIEKLKEQRKLLSACGKIPGNPFYHESYEKKSQCKPGGENLFKNIVTSFKSLREKLKNLGKKEEWKDILSTDGWKNLNADGALDRQAEARARSWIQKNNINRIAGLDKLFSSPKDQRNDLQNGEDTLDANAADQEGEDVQEATRHESLMAAFQELTAILTASDQWLKKVKEVMYEDLLVIYQNTAAEYWRYEMRKMREGEPETDDDPPSPPIPGIIHQTAHLKELQDAFESFVNHQAQNR